MTQASDGQLVDAVRARQEAAAEEIVRRHWHALVHIADLILRDLPAAEDVAQEAMLSGLKALDRFDSDRPLRPWLARIAANAAVSQARKRARRPEAVLESEAAAGSGAGGGDSDPFVAEREDLAHALAELDPEVRAMVVYRYVLDYQSQEIAEELGLPAATVRTKLKRALDRMRIELREVEDAD